MLLDRHLGKTRKHADIAQLKSVGSPMAGPEGQRLIASYLH
jgi:hypothetical protein